jgi:hypothetical protein
MLRLRLLSEAPPRSKNGQPPHRTTGVASASCTHTEFLIDSHCQPNNSAPIARARRGTERTALIHKRRLMSTSSGLGPSSSVDISGSSAMPQIGQLPGPIWRICGCIGQIQIAPSGTSSAAVTAAFGCR